MRKIAQVCHEQYTAVLGKDHEQVLRTMSYDEICAKIAQVKDVNTVPEDDVYGVLGSMNMTFLKQALESDRNLTHKPASSASKATYTAKHGGQFGHANMRESRGHSQSKEVRSGESRASSASSGSSSYNVAGSSRSDTGSEQSYVKTNERSDWRRSRK